MKKKGSAIISILGYWFVINALINIVMGIVITRTNIAIPVNLDTGNPFIAIPLLIVGFVGIYVTMVSEIIHLYLPLLIGWSIAILLCGIYLLRRKNIGRVTIIGLSIVSLAILVISWLLPNKSLGIVSVEQRILSAFFPIIYIHYFTLPKVKEQFK